MIMSSPFNSSANCRMTLGEAGFPILTRAGNGRRASRNPRHLRTGGRLACRLSHKWTGQSERYGVIATSGRGLRYEAFVNHQGLALHMARFPEAERRRLHKMICMQCYARNAMRATRCRKCGSRELRPKAKEARKE